MEGMEGRRGGKEARSQERMRRKELRKGKEEREEGTTINTHTLYIYIHVYTEGRGRKSVVRGRRGVVCSAIAGMQNPWVVGKGKRLAGNSFPNKIWMAGNRPSWREP